MIIRRRNFLRLAAAALSLSASTMAFAQGNYPVRPVRVIVPFPAGGGVDILARLVTQNLSERLGQQFYVENIAGAAGSAGTGVAAKAAPDGYTVLFVFGSFVVNPSLFAKVPYDPFKDFQPVTLAASTTTVLIVNPSVPSKTLSELVGLIKGSSGKYSYASGGFGTQPHLAGEQLRVAGNLDLVHVPFGGAGPAVVSVVGGHTPIGFSSLAAALPQIKDGKLRALAVTSKTRSSELPDLPTMAEAGYPAILGDSWVGVLVPTGTPREITTLLHRRIAEFISSSETKARLATLGYEPIASTPEEFAERIKSESQAWARVIEAAHIRVN